MAETCVWQHDEYHEYWDTECGQSHSFIDGTPKQNHHKFCPYCGKEIKEKQDADQNTL